MRRNSRSDGTWRSRLLSRWAHLAILPALLLAMAQGGRTAAAPPDGRSPVRSLVAPLPGDSHAAPSLTALPGGAASTAEPVGATGWAAATPASSQAASSPSQAAGAAPAGWLDSVQHNLEQQEYELSWQNSPVVDGVEPSWHAPNRAQGFRTYFTHEGIRVVPRESTAVFWRWGLSLVGYGNGEKTWDVPGASLAASGRRMAYRRGAFEESYVNTPEGLEQGFILPAPPGSSGAGGIPPESRAWRTPLRKASTENQHASGAERALVDSAGLVHVDLALWGDLSPRVSEDGQAIHFVTPAGTPVLHYAQLKVTDARGSVLHSWMEGFAGEGVRGIRLVLDAKEAVYPITIDPLSTGWAWTAQTSQGSAYLGNSVATAGDVNGDGFSDVIISAPYFDNGQADEGRAYVYLGSASILGSVAAWTAEGDLGSASFGASVATAGDVNGDGYSDVIVGASGYTNGQTNEGRAYLYLGSASGLAPSAAWTAESDQASASFGTSVAPAGDVNGDGYSDVVIGASGYTNGQTAEGRAYLFLGSASGLQASPAWTSEGDQDIALYGYSVASAGDVNGDGYSDAIVGAYGYSNDQNSEGRAYLYLGSAAGLAPSAAWTVESNQGGSYFGFSVATAGDVNGDGYSDILVGAPLYSNGQSGEGRAYLYFGSASGPSPTPAWTAESNQASIFNNGTLFGGSVASAGDINGDGYADVIVGCQYYDNGQRDEGRAFLYLGSGSGLALTEAWTAESDQVNASFGRSVAPAGDVNGDGYSDVIVGAPDYDGGALDSGRVFLYIGSASGPASIAAWTAEGGEAYASFGYSVATAGDVNGDGYADIIIGEQGYTNGQSKEGRAHVYLGSATGLGTIADWTAESDQVNAIFGSSVATAGDVNGDGYSDVIVGAQNYDNGQIDQGRAYVYLGSASGVSPVAAWTAEDGEAYARFGYSVATAGDVNGDGYSDVIIGAVGDGISHDVQGRAYVYLGSASGVSPSPAWRVESDQALSYFGASVATAGDVNGDGYSDIIVGDPWYENGPDAKGRAYVYLGSASGVSPSAAWTAGGDQAVSDFGAPVATAGDVNGDGYSDVIVGAPWYSAGQYAEGRVHVYLGSASGLSSSPAWVVDGQQAGAHFGRSAGTSGDVNGDGYSDVVVGAIDYNNGEAAEGQVYVYLGSAAGLALSPAWTEEGNLFAARFGRSVGTSGDVNGDGYADVIVGADNYNTGQGYEGRAYVYFGNGGGLSVHPQQRRSDDTAPIAPLGRSNAPGSFRLAALGKTPFGRSRVRLEWEVKPLGTPFNGLGTQQSAAPIDTGTDGTGIDELVTGLGPGVHHWRIRFRYGTAATPFAQGSRWFTIPWNGSQEADLRSGAFVGGFAWDDLDGDGIREAGEPGHAGVLVSLYSGGSTIVAEKTTLADGTYNFDVPGAGPYQLLFTTPSGYTYTIPKQGGDDMVDSDVDQMIGLTVPIGPAFTAADASRWSAGLISCPGPTLPISIVGARLAPGTTNVILDFTDPNQPGTTTGATGYNVYRSSQPQPPPAPWMLIAGGAGDDDPGTPSIQLTDWTGDPLAVGGVFYYQVLAYSYICGTEGP